MSGCLQMRGWASGSGLEQRQATPTGESFTFCREWPALESQDVRPAGGWSAWTSNPSK